MMKKNSINPNCVTKITQLCYSVLFASLFLLLHSCSVFKFKKEQKVQGVNDWDSRIASTSINSTNFSRINRIDFGLKISDSLLKLYGNNLIPITVKQIKHKFIDSIIIKKNNVFPDEQAIFAEASFVVFPSKEHFNNLRQFTFYLKGHIVPYIENDTLFGELLFDNFRICNVKKNKFFKKISWPANNKKQTKSSKITTVSDPIKGVINGILSRYKMKFPINQKIYEKDSLSKMFKGDKNAVVNSESPIDLKLSLKEACILISKDGIRILGELDYGNNSKKIKNIEDGLDFYLCDDKDVQKNIFNKANQNRSSFKENNLYYDPILVGSDFVYNPYYIDVTKHIITNGNYFTNKFQVDNSTPTEILLRELDTLINGKQYAFNAAFKLYKNQFDSIWNIEIGTERYAFKNHFELDYVNTSFSKFFNSSFRNTKLNVTYKYDNEAMQILNGESFELFKKPTIDCGIFRGNCHLEPCKGWNCCGCKWYKPHCCACKVGSAIFVGGCKVLHFGKYLGCLAGEEILFLGCQAVSLAVNVIHDQTKLGKFYLKSDPFSVKPTINLDKVKLGDDINTFSFDLSLNVPSTKIPLQYKIEQNTVLTWVLCSNFFGFVYLPLPITINSQKLDLTVTGKIEKKTHANGNAVLEITPDKQGFSLQMNPSPIDQVSVNPIFMMNCRIIWSGLQIGRLAQNIFKGKLKETLDLAYKGKYTYTYNPKPFSVELPSIDININNLPKGKLKSSWGPRTIQYNFILN